MDSLPRPAVPVSVVVSVEVRVGETWGRDYTPPVTKRTLPVRLGISVSGLNLTPVIIGGFLRDARRSPAGEKGRKFGLKMVKRDQ